MKKREKWIVFLLISVLIVQTLSALTSSNLKGVEIVENTEEPYSLKEKKDPLLNQKDWEFHLIEKGIKSTEILFVLRNEMLYSQHYGEVHIPPPKI